MLKALFLRALPLAAALAVVSSPTASLAANPTNYPPMTIERIDAHRQEVVTAGSATGKALKLTQKAQRVNGSPSGKDVVTDESNVVYSPTTGALSYTLRKTSADGTSRVWLTKCVSAKRCWTSQDGKTWQVVTVVVRINESAGLEGFIVQETLSENRAVLVRPTEPGSLTVALGPNGVRSVGEASLFGQTWALTQALSTTKTPKIKAPARKVIKPADGRVENIWIR